MRPFRKIAELVDKDVASNWKPVSLLGMFVPFLPFMLFSDGAPAQSHPILGGMALAAGASWGLFVTCRAARHMRSEARRRGHVDRLIRRGMMRRFRRGDWLPVIRRKK